MCCEVLFILFKFLWSSFEDSFIFYLWGNLFDNSFYSFIYFFVGNPLLVFIVFINLSFPPSLHFIYTLYFHWIIYYLFSLVLDHKYLLPRYHDNGMIISGTIYYIVFIFSWLISRILICNKAYSTKWEFTSNIYVSMSWFFLTDIW